MRTITFKTGVLVITLVSILTAGVIFAFSAFVEEIADTQTAPRITFFEVVDNNFEAHILNVSRVEVWEIATSSQVIDNVVIGSMEHRDGVWTLPVPHNPRIVKTYEARAYNDSGKVVDIQPLPVIGKNETYTYVWGPKEDRVQAVTVGERFRYNDMVFVVDRVLNDTRCPDGFQCIRAGSVAFLFSLTSPRGTFTGNAQTDKPIEIDRYIIHTREVLPVRSIADTPLEKYHFTFEVFMNTETLSIEKTN